MTVEFNMPQHMCNNCKKKSPEYHELKVQIRFKFFEDLDELENVKVNVHKLIYSRLSNEINKFEESEWRFDIFFRSKDLLNKISSLFQKKYLCEEIRTKKVVGRDSLTMTDVFRYVLLINIINLERGDKIKFKGVDYYIKNLNNNDLILRNCIDGSKLIITYGLYKDYIQLIKKKAIDFKTNTLL